MAWEVLFDREFKAWYSNLEIDLREEITTGVNLLEIRGPNLGRPKVDTIKGSKIPNLKELRIQFKGEPWRILFAFDPKRKCILLIGGNKTGDERWYKTNIPIAENRYFRYLNYEKR